MPLLKLKWRAENLLIKVEQFSACLFYRHYRYLFSFLFISLSILPKPIDQINNARVFKYTNVVVSFFFVGFEI